MHKTVNILVTGAGSELAFSIIKAARLISFPIQLHGCDMNDEVVGKYWVDQFHFLPPARDKDAYVEALSRLIVKYRIEIVIPTADAEFEILAEARQFLCDKYNCHVLVNQPEEITRFSDKWEAYKWYVSNEIPTPRTYLAETQNDVERALQHLSFPIVVKPRTGGGSRYIRRIDSEGDLWKYLPSVPNALIQEYLQPDTEEYTAGTYLTSDGQVHVIVMHRTLKFGMTNTAVSIPHCPGFEAFCQDTILKTKLVGSNNIQFRNCANGPKVLEINARFSGTTGIRAHCGFNDVEMWIADSLKLGKALKPTIKQKLILRYMDELYIDNNTQ